MEYIDAKGLTCPIPVVKAKKALESPDVDAVRIKVDNFIAVQNLEKMAHGLGYEFSHKEISDIEYDAILAKSKHDINDNDNDNKGNRNTYDPDRSTDYTIKEIGESLLNDIKNVVIVIGCEALGRGSNEHDRGSADLGRMLMKSFIYTLTELKSKPKVLLFLNSGVLLTSAASEALTDLHNLANTGVRILSCGACLNYYKLDKPAVGEVTNMLEIVTIITGAAKVINL